MNQKILSRFLSNTHCYQCGLPLEDAEVTFLFRASVASIIHVRCEHCGAETLATLSVSGHQVTDIQTDLTSSELKRFFASEPISVDDVLDIYELIQKKDLWQLLKQKREKFSGKKSKSSAGEDTFLRSSLKEEKLPSR
ncbi:MAG: hypothetical protein U9M98_00545 [Patescibacteria group bacterium]|nr:hypothetical protein [Patescibacteria group bacterium]